MLLPPDVIPFLAVYAQLGVILYMFLVGLELDLAGLRKSGHVTLAISHASIVIPFLLGSALRSSSIRCWRRATSSSRCLRSSSASPMSVTAFPVLARTLTDQSLSRSEMGTIALTCAAIDDATAWCLLALVVSIAQERSADAVRTILLTAAYVILMLHVVAPVVRRLVPRVHRSADLPRAALSIVFMAMLASAATPESIGIRGFLGAFLFGAVIPQRSRIAVELNHRLGDFVAVFFLPAFFAFTGMRTEIGLVSGWDNWLLCGAIVAVACVGKIGGTLVASRCAGLAWRDSAVLGILMNTRGLVELIVLNIGLDLGVISPTLFTMLVLMALGTTLVTAPILDLLLRGHPWAGKAEDERRRQNLPPFASRLQRVT
jgi:Kef-type K+ transport system membrane component KefB